MSVCDGSFFFFFSFSKLAYFSCVYVRGSKTGILPHSLLTRRYKEKNPGYENSPEWQRFNVLQPSSSQRTEASISRKRNTSTCFLPNKMGDESIDVFIGNDLRPPSSLLTLEEYIFDICLLCLLKIATERFWLKCKQPKILTQKHYIGLQRSVK